MRFKGFCVTLLTGLFICSTAEAVDLRFSGFGDVVVGGSSGDAADNVQAAKYAANGVAPHPLSEIDGAGITGVDFVVIADLENEITFLGEVNLQTDRGTNDELGLDVERIFVNQELTPGLNIQAGLFFTPIGYHNRFLYSRAWLMKSIKVPDLFEEDLNLVPTHTIGVMAHGGFDLKSGNTLNYAVSIGNGRPTTPNAAVYGRDSNNKSKEIAGLVELIVPSFKNSRFGISAWTDEINSVKLDALGDNETMSTGRLHLQETGFDIYAIYHASMFQIDLEYVHSTHKDKQGNLPQSEYDFNGLMAEVSLRLQDGRLHPYIRYDRTDLPEDSGFYYGLRGGDNGIERLFVPDDEAVMIGAAYDLNTHTRVKLELSHHMDGVRDENGLSMQIAFGF